MAPVLTLREAPHHPHLVARGTFTDHGGITQPAPAPRFSATPTAVRTGPALPGADTREVARDWDIPGLVTDLVNTPAANPAQTPATTSVKTSVEDFPHQGD